MDQPHLLLLSPSLEAWSSLPSPSDHPSTSLCPGTEVYLQPPADLCPQEHTFYTDGGLLPTLMPPDLPQAEDWMT